MRAIVVALGLLVSFAVPAYADNPCHLPGVQGDCTAFFSRLHPGTPVAGQPGATWQHGHHDGIIGWYIQPGTVLNSPPEHTAPPIPPPDPGIAWRVAESGIFLPGWRYIQKDLNGGSRIVILSVTTGLDGRIAVLGQVYYHPDVSQEGTIIAFTPGAVGAPEYFVNGPWPVGTRLENGWRLDQIERGR